MINDVNKETLDSLIDNAKLTILNSEQLLRNTERIKLRLSASPDLVYLQLIIEALSGSLSAVYEVCSDMKNMLSTDNVYVKRFHMQMINLSQYEWCKYLVGRNQGGVLSKLINHLNEFQKNTKELDDIAQHVRLLGQQCDLILRNVTAHYDNPNTMYTMFITLNSEDVYAKRVSIQLLIHDMILQYTSVILQQIIKTLGVDKNGDTDNKSNDKMSLVDILNNKVAESFHYKAKLGIVITEQMASAWEDIQSQRKNYIFCEKIIEYLKNKKLGYGRLAEIRLLAELRWTISFMRYDLICSINSYLNACSNAERSISFMRAYRIEISALSHLYGYNDEYKEKSIWNKIKSISEFKSIPLSDQIERALNALMSNLDPDKRNLYTHYRENEELNISERWRCVNEMNHPKELIHMLRLMKLCKTIDQFLFVLILSMSLTGKRKNDEILKPIIKIKELASQNNQQEIVELSDKLLSIFSLFTKNGGCS